MIFGNTSNNTLEGGTGDDEITGEKVLIRLFTTSSRILIPVLVITLAFLPLDLALATLTNKPVLTASQFTIV